MASTAPGSESVSRDPGGIYAQATRVATPGAVQGADRWHLLRNVSAALKNALSPHHRLFAHAARTGTGEAPEDATAPTPSVPPWELRTQQKNGARRFSRYEEVLWRGQDGSLTCFDCPATGPRSPHRAQVPQSRNLPRSAAESSLRHRRSLRRLP